MLNSIRGICMIFPENVFPVLEFNRRITCVFVLTCRDLHLSNIDIRDVKLQRYKENPYKHSAIISSL